jgi:hypothetical protein
MQTRSGGAELFLAEGMTDRLKDRHNEANSRCSKILRTRLKTITLDAGFTNKNETKDNGIS